LPLHILYSNRSEALLAALARDVAAARVRVGPLAPIDVVVSSRAVEARVKLALARAHGVAANIRARFLENLIADLAHDGGTDDDRVGGSVRGRWLDGTGWRGAVLALLLDEELLRRPELDPVREYLYAAGDHADAVDLRRAQLSARLGQLFLEYGYTRPDLGEAWARGASACAPTQATTEAWQRCLWRELDGSSGVFDPSRLLTRGGHGLPATALPETLFVVGFSSFAPLFHHVIAAVATRRPVHVYALNPCREFWEDAAPGATGATALLRAWGRPGQAHMRALNQAAGYDFETAFCDPGGATLLARIQSDLLHDEPATSDGGGGAGAGDHDPRPRIDPITDDSFQILACPSVAREAEIIAAEIWRLVQADAALGFDDIAVVLAGREHDAYLTHLPAAFRAAFDLPAHLAEVPLVSQSRWVEAVRLLLALPLSSFTRKDVLGLATHPAVLRRFGDVDPAEWPGQWADWCDQLGIVHGADHADHAGTYIERDIYNWDQGLRRLALGTVLGSPASGDSPVFTAPAGEWLAQEHGLSSQAGVAKLGLLVRSLLGDARFARAARLPIADWAAFLCGAITTYLWPGSAAEERDRLRCLQRIEGLARLPLGEVAISYRLAYELAWPAIAAMTGTRGQPAGRGVTIAPLASMRALDHQVVFVAGLGEGLFPAVGAPDPLDLRASQPRPGDVDPRARDLHAFLDLLLAPRRNLILSYVARDALTGETFAPSPVVHDLLRTIVARHVAPDRLAAVTRRHPLRRYEPAPGPTSAAPEAAAEAHARALGRDLRATLGCLGDLPPPGELGRILPPPASAALRDRLGLIDPPPPAVRTRGSLAPPETISISFAELRRFLDCPLQESARHALGLREDDEPDPLAHEDEPFALSRLDDIVLLREVFGAAARAADLDGLERIYDELAELGELGGGLPTGVFAESLRGRHIADLRVWRALVEDATGPAGPAGATGPAMTIYRFGRADEHEAIDRIHDPIVLDVELAGAGAGADAASRRVRVALHGRTELVCAAAGVSFTLIKRATRRGWWKDARDRRDTLRGFFDHVVLSAAGLTAGRAHAAAVCNCAGDAERVTARFRPFMQDEARAYLSILAVDLLAGVHAYRLPVEAVFRAVHGKRSETWHEAITEAYTESAASKFGPVADVERFPIPSELEAAAMADRRFGPYFAKLEEIA
jgi:exodeoxyribonuclease V gamma subunit